MYRISLHSMWQIPNTSRCFVIQDTRYFILQYDTTFIISTYTINKVKYNNYFIIDKHCDRAIKTLNYTPIITHVTLVVN